LFNIAVVNGQCSNFHGINSAVEISCDILPITAYVILSIMWQYKPIHMITLEWR